MNRGHTHTDLLVQNYCNFNSSGAPARFMYYDGGSWSDFSADVANHLRVEFSHRRAVFEAEVDGVHCLFDFYRMLQVRLDAGDQRSIAWIDFDRNCFFPKRFVDGNGKFSGGGGGDGAIEEVVLEGSCSNFEVVSPRWPKARVLEETERAYSALRNLFLGSVGAVDPGARITGIHQVVRPEALDKARFDVFQKQLATTIAARGGRGNMRFCWHGTSEKEVEVILKHGFSKFSKLEAAEAYGVGVYLSPVGSALSSATVAEVDGNGEKHVILCRTILGNSEKIEAGSQQMYPSSGYFDTGVDDLKDPKWFVVWGAYMNTHILPEMVVSYRPSNHALGSLRGTPAVKIPVWNSLSNSYVLSAKLLSHVGTFLPSARVHEFQTLCSAYMDGKMAKDNFWKQLRSMVGEDVLVSAIREFRGRIE